MICSKISKKVIYLVARKVGLGTVNRRWSESACQKGLQRSYCQMTKKTSSCCADLTIFLLPVFFVHFHQLRWPFVLLPSEQPNREPWQSSESVNLSGTLEDLQKVNTTGMLTSKGSSCKKKKAGEGTNPKSFDFFWIIELLCSPSSLQLLRQCCSKRSKYIWPLSLPKYLQVWVIAK